MLFQLIDLVHYLDENVKSLQFRDSHFLSAA